MDEDQHDKIFEFAEERGTTFSSFVRRAVEARYHRLDNDDVARDFQPLLDEIESVGERVESLTPLLEQLRSLIEEQTAEKAPEGSTDDAAPFSDDVAEEVFGHIRRMESATIPDLVEQTSHDRPTVRGAIARLESDFVITELEDDRGVPAWGVR